MTTSTLLLLTFFFFSLAQIPVIRQYYQHGVASCQSKKFVDYFLKPENCTSYFSPNKAYSCNQREFRNYLCNESCGNCQWDNSHRLFCKEDLLHQCEARFPRPSSSGFYMKRFKDSRCRGEPMYPIELYNSGEECLEHDLSIQAFYNEKEKTVDLIEHQDRRCGGVVDVHHIPLNVCTKYTDHGWRMKAGSYYVIVTKMV